MIESIYIKNFKIFKEFKFNLNSGLNILVGNNESGKSTILEAINLALTKRLNNRPLEYELNTYLFNQECVNSYIAAIRSGISVDAPKIIVELYLSDKPEFARFRGSINSQGRDVAGIRLEIALDDDYKTEYQQFITHKLKIKTVPIEYYKVSWFSFANTAITTRGQPLNCFYIDATSIRLQSGTDYYIQDIIGKCITDKERVELDIAYRGLKEMFSGEAPIQKINSSFNQGTITNKHFSIGIDLSQKYGWVTNISPYVDDLPLALAGKGEQTALKILLAIEKNISDTDILLIEEPENHLSHSAMSNLIARISEKCPNRQILITTHSTFVLNKLGINCVTLLHDQRTTSLYELKDSTRDYFIKLSGYDTLRLILSQKCILVEGPSDELIFQRAYKDSHGHLPIEDEIDVVNIRGLSFARFIEIAQKLNKPVFIITDNDGDYQHNIAERYSQYISDTIKVFASDNDNLQTLEPQLAGCNSLDVLNSIFETTFQDKDALVKYMLNNKTECALKIFQSVKSIKFPEYIKNAVG